jgi:hypothetical protein
MLTVSGREFVALAAVERMPDEKVIQYVSTSDPSRHAGLEDGKLVQAHVYLSGWNLKALNDGSIQTDYVVRVDVGGSIPGPLMEFLQLSSLGCIAKIQDFLDSRGPIPFVIHRSHDSQFQDLRCAHEVFDSKAGIYDLQISNSGPKETYFTVALPRLTYPFAQIDVSGIADSKKALIRLRSLEDFGHPRDLSSATGWILQVPLGPQTSVSIHVRPNSESHSLNGQLSMVSMSVKEKVSTKDGIPCSGKQDIPFPRAQKLLSKIDELWDSSVNGTAGYLRVMQCSCNSFCWKVQCSCSTAYNFSSNLLPKIRRE